MFTLNHGMLTVKCGQVGEVKTHHLTVNIRKKWGKYNLKILQIILLLTRPAFKRNYFSKPSTILCQSLTGLGERIYSIPTPLVFLSCGKEKKPTPAHSSQPVPPKGVKIKKGNVPFKFIEAQAH